MAGRSRHAFLPARTSHPKRAKTLFYPPLALRRTQAAPPATFISNKAGTMTWRRRKQFKGFDAWLERLTGSGLFSSTFSVFCWGLFSELYLFGRSPHGVEAEVSSREFRCEFFLSRPNERILKLSRLRRRKFEWAWIDFFRGCVVHRRGRFSLRCITRQSSITSSADRNTRTANKSKREKKSRFVVRQNSDRL